MFQTPAIKFIFGLGLCSLGGAMLYMYFKNKEEEDDTNIPDEKENAKKKEVALQLTISNEIVPTVMGRGGANLKVIEEKTGTVIRFREKDDNNQYCEIRGQLQNVEKAKAMLMKEIQSSPIVNEEIFVPQTACGKIIGRCGESLQEICRISHAKVSVDSGDRSSGNKTRRVVITGNRKQVNTAKKLIQDKINEDVAFRKSLEESLQKRERRRSPTNSVSSTHSSMTSLGPQLPPSEKLNNSDSDKPLEVYVSAIASPAKFWLQLIGPQTRKLDELVENMTEYYSKAENQAQHRIADPYLGQIVAALFKYDGKWYRAEIVGILPNEYNPRDVVLDLYFVDYGDSEYIAPNEVFELRTDFLTLRFQAIECFLADVKPALSNDPDLWDQQSIARFEELTHVASWKKLISRVVTYKERPKGGNHIRREGSPVPGVRLYDTSEGVQINIAHTLAAEGYAIPDYIAESETSDVLRLGGGSFRNSTQSISSSTRTSHENIALPQQQEDANKNPEDKIMTNGVMKYLSNGTVKTDALQNKIDLNDMKANSQNLLHAEKLNGNIVADKSNNFIDHNQWNHLVQS
ncbi:unnamed protein product [Hermetia illucens]|uniref:Tudor domain-containing protein n=1 Tax=Hermetia illucens TaxID=343691 RepID=A0A7R8YN10_HERIL|nr:tudor and KH domain-containing protein homolog [Hermetia illucens]XP_037906697.1 tudor and KH domain-containing protein homolog [Hermetia illucens]XP_037906706.1 tudor and KH domain-containing protein homolog [Hermetia illucens]CAD7079191.1 unnamed protein product [Hermetia illucens]